jgi:predicted amidohydrolase
LANKTVRIGMAQLLVEGGEPSRNLERAVKLIEEAAKDQCRIVILPETLDFAWTHPSALLEAESIPGPFSDILCKAAVAHNIYVCAGLTEKLDGKIYNSAIFIDPKGKIILKYHKINLLSVEQPFYEVGASLHVVDTEFGKIGINICADNYFESLCIGHTLARMGAQILLSPSSWTCDYNLTEIDDPYREKWIKPFQTLASLYDLVVISTTSVGYIVGGPYEGKKSVGCSLAVNKDGIVKQGSFNEFSGELISVDITIPERTEKGTDITERLKGKGHSFS